MNFVEKLWLKITIKIIGRTKMFKKIMGWFSGKKLYITAVAGIVNELAKVAEAGDLGAASWTVIWACLMAIFGRQAVAKAEKKNG